MQHPAAAGRGFCRTFAERNCLQTILLDPTVDSYRQAVEMMDEMITLQQGLLPQFVD